MAIDGQLLDGADYLMYVHTNIHDTVSHDMTLFLFCYRADKYLKQAEDDVSLVLVPKIPLTVNQ